jgi:hypothetical protein
VRSDVRAVCSRGGREWHFRLQNTVMKRKLVTYISPERVQIAPQCEWARMCVGDNVFG